MVFALFITVGSSPVRRVVAKVKEIGIIRPMFYPDFESIISAADSEGLLTIHRSLRSILSNLIVFFLLVVIVYALILIFGDVGFSEDIPVLRNISLRWLAIIPLAALLEIIRRYHDDLYVFGIDNVTHHHGRLSLSSKLPSVKYLDIHTLAVQQDIFGRVFDYGNVLLDTAGEVGVELTISGVRAPHEVMGLVERFRSHGIESHTRHGRSPGTE